MSYTINATQSKWFGFSPKYVWEEFVVEHASKARRIKKETFEKFMEMDELESEIKEISRKILKEEKFDVNKFTERVKMKRTRSKREATYKREDSYDSNSESDSEGSEKDSSNGTCKKCEELEKEVEDLKEELKECQKERDRWRIRYKTLQKSMAE